MVLEHHDTESDIIPWCHSKWSNYVNIKKWSNTKIVYVLFMFFISFSFDYDYDNLSRDMTKPTKWVHTQQRLRLAWVSAQSDQKLLLPSLIARQWVGRQTQWWPRHKAIYFSWLGPELFCLLLGPPGFNCWFSFAPVFQWYCSTPQGSPGVGRNTFLSSPHLCFIIVFICD